MSKSIFGFKKIEEVNLAYADIRNEIDAWLTSLDEKISTLATQMGTTEQRTRVCARQRNRENTPAETAQDYWKRTVAIPFLDTICSEMRCRFSDDKRAHFEHCSLIPEVIISKNSEVVIETAKILHAKWEYVLPEPSTFESEIVRWMNYWKRQEPLSPSMPVTSILANHANETFFPNVRELLIILVVLPIGSTEAEILLLPSSYTHMAPKFDGNRAVV